MHAAAQEEEVSIYMFGMATSTLQHCRYAAKTVEVRDGKCVCVYVCVCVCVCVCVM